MKIKYLGTAAAEGYPAMFCSCENCKKARKLGGRNIRGRAQALIDDKLMIDCPADAFVNSVKYGIDMLNVRHCLITHVHEDHLYATNFVYLYLRYEKPGDDWKGLTVCGSAETKEVIDKLNGPDERKDFLQLEPFKPVKLGEYEVTALKAIHGTKHPYIYAVSKDNKNLLYAHDTDIFPEETWNYLKKAGIRFDLVSFDCTEGAFMGEIRYKGHMGLGYNIKCRDMMKEAGLADQNTTFVLNHFSHNAIDSVYDEFVNIAKEYDFQVSYDGMEIEI